MVPLTVDVDGLYAEVIRYVGGPFIGYLWYRSSYPAFSWLERRYHKWVMSRLRAKDKMHQTWQRAQDAELGKPDRETHQATLELIHKQSRELEMMRMKHTNLQERLDRLAADTASSRGVRDMSVRRNNYDPVTNIYYAEDENYYYDHKRGNWALKTHWREAVTKQLEGEW